MNSSHQTFPQLPSLLNLLQENIDGEEVDVGQ